jgi:hypothetical protein
MIIKKVFFLAPQIRGVLKIFVGWSGARSA